MTPRAQIMVTKCLTDEHVRRVLEYLSGVLVRRSLPASRAGQEEEDDDDRDRWYDDFYDMWLDVVAENALV